MPRKVRSAIAVCAVMSMFAGALASGCAGGGTPGVGGAGGRPGASCKRDADCPVLAICQLCSDGTCANPNVHCVDGACSPPNYTCPKESDAGAGAPCRSTQECKPGQRCTVEDGACNPPPGCAPGMACPAVCYGVCSAGAG